MQGVAHEFHGALSPVALSSYQATVPAAMPLFNRLEIPNRSSIGREKAGLLRPSAWIGGRAAARSLGVGLQTFR